MLILQIRQLEVVEEVEQLKVLLREMLQDSLFALDDGVPKVRDRHHHFVAFGKEEEQFLPVFTRMFDATKYEMKMIGWL